MTSTQKKLAQQNAIKNGWLSQIVRIKCKNNSDDTDTEDENDEETDVLRQEVPGEAVCFFNSQSYPTGAYVKSGTSLLKCDYGVWIPAGPSDPDNI